LSNTERPYPLNSSQVSAIKAIQRDLLSLFRYGDLIRALVSRDLKVRYKRSVLGYAWTLLDPLMTMLVFILVFGVLLHMSTDHFPIYLLTGLIPWVFFANAITTSVECITSNVDLIRRVFFPREIFPLTLVVSNGINMLFGLIVILPLILIYGLPITIKIFLLPIPIFLLLLFTWGVGLFFSCLNVFFRDMTYIVPFLVQLLFFLTPIFYKVQGTIPAKYVGIYLIANPLAVILSLFRASLMAHPIPDMKYIFICFATCVLIFLVGYLFFKKNEDRMVKRI